MYKKKIIGIALIAAMVSSMTAVSVSAGRVGFDGDDTIDNYFENHTIGIVGAMTNWADGADVPMTDPDGDGVYVGVYKDLEAGGYDFKVRADGIWEDSWGAYEESEDRTMNSQVNCHVDVTDKTDLIVMLDTNGDDEVVWPVTFFTTESAEASKYGICGSMTGWGETPDAPMYEYAEGKYVGIIKDLAASTYAFKVRVDSDWAESYGVYEPDYDRTNNSQTNCGVVIEADEESGDVVVFFDTTGDDDMIWPVSWTGVTDNGSLTEVFSGKYENDDSEEPTLTPSKYGICGTMTDWGGKPDFVMYETEEKGIVTGLIVNLEGTDFDSMKMPAGDYSFKVRADSAWTDSWGVYEEAEDRTYNSQTNLSVSLTEPAVIMVKFDTNGEDQELWPVSYAICTELGAEPQWIYTGKKVEEESKTEESKTEESKTEESKTDTSVPVDEPSKPEFYETKVTDYIYFDNSQTKWDEVYAYWWHTDYARTYDLENNDWGIQKKVNDDGTEGWEPVPFPGTKMTQIEGTDIWQVRVPFGATAIIFNSNFTDDDVKDPAKKNGYQTGDLKFDAAVNAGQIYVIDATPTTEDPTDKKANPTPGRGVFKAKYTYKVGEWKDYTEYAAAKGVEAKFMSEQIGEIPQTSTDDGTSTVVPEPSQQQSQTQPSSQNVPQNSTATPISTGDATMPIAVAVVAALALGTALVTSRKKTEE